MTTEISFSLEEADLVALARHQMERSPSIQKRYRLQKYGLVLGFLALVTGVVWGKTPLALYFAGLALRDIVEEQRDRTEGALRAAHERFSAEEGARYQSEEFSSLEDIVLGTRVLLRTTWMLDAW